MRNDTDVVQLREIDDPRIASTTGGPEQTYLGGPLVSHDTRSAGEGNSQFAYLDRPGWDIHHPQAGDLTLGDFATEAESVDCLAAILDHTGAFSVHQEVAGEYTFRRPHQDQASPRIDMILTPSALLVASGWKIGPVGVECKRSSVKVGRPISQAIDYSRALWKLPTFHNQWISLSFIFLWPFAPQHGPLGSVFSQQRLGSIWTTEDDGQLHISSGQHPIATLGAGPRTWKTYPNNMDHGRKAGSR